MSAFDSLLSALASLASIVSQRSEGAGFLRALKTLYPLETATYCCINMHDHARNQYAHCVFSDAAVAHYLSQSCINVARSATANNSECWPSPDSSLTFWPRARVGETAAFRIGLPQTGAHVENTEVLGREL